MHCPYCRKTDTRVLDSRVADDGSSIRRRRTCASCEKRFTTVEQMQLMVLKRSGASEPFNRDKAIAGVRKACKGRPVTEDQLACLGQAVEDALRLSGQAELNANEVGLAILSPLRELDEVAYLRFASVYRAFDSAEDFENEIEMLRAERRLEQADGEPVAVPATSG
jgi:transcriptional repressor NrdR